MEVQVLSSALCLYIWMSSSLIPLANNEHCDETRFSSVDSYLLRALCLVGRCRSLLWRDRWDLSARESWNCTRAHNVADRRCETKELLCTSHCPAIYSCVLEYRFTSLCYLDAPMARCTISVAARGCNLVDQRDSLLRNDYCFAEAGYSCRLKCAGTLPRKLS